MASRMRTLLSAAVVLTIVLGTRGHAEPAAQQQQPQQQQQQQPQQPAPQTGDQQQPPVFRTGINFVRVDVIISDKSGAPINDLKESDFDVTEDGKPQKIETFKFVKLDGGIGDAVKEPPREIRTDYDEEMEAARDDVRLFAIFLDDYHVRRGTSMSVRNQVSMSAIKSLITHMGSLKEGRKSLILVTEGYTNIIPPQMRNADAQQPGLGNPAYGNPNAGANDINEDRAAWMANTDMDSDLRDIYDTANHNNVSIYT